MTIDTMLKISDENGSGVFSLYNNLKQPSFISISSSKVIVDKNGKLHKEAYTSDNLSKWEVALTQNKLILDANREKKVGIRALCADGCDRSKDSVFAVKFLPQPYFKKGEKPKSAVNINYGYEPIFVIPAKNPDYKYDIIRNDNYIIVNNKSNSLIKVLVNQCKDKSINVNCSKKIVVLAGRKRKDLLPSEARDDNLNIQLTGYDNSYYKNYSLSKNEPIRKE
ncbi:TPA: hypothetical protein ACX6S1_001863 [Photobacterium damselae]